MKSHIPRWIAAALSGLGLTGAGHAQTVDWGTSTSLTPLTYLSGGATAGSGLTWTLGWFTNGFIPSAANYDQWVTNYHQVDLDAELQQGGFYAVAGHIDDVGAAAANRQAYIFAYNDLGLIGLSGGEALLFRENGFLFPTVPNQGTFDIANNAADPADDSFDVIWGRVDRNRNALGGVVSGGGIVGSPLPDTATRQWEAQTATWPVPEPSVVLIASLGNLLLLRRRHR